MSDTTGIFLSLLLFTLLFSGFKKETQLLDLQELLTGAVFSLAVFARFEYILLLLPMSVLIFVKSKQPLFTITNILTSFVVISTLIFVALFPVNEAVLLGFSQFPTLIIGSFAGLVLVVFGIILFQKYKKRLQKLPYHNLAFFFYILALFPALLSLTGRQLPYLVGFGNFIRYDFLMASAAFAGIGLLFKNKRYGLAAFVLVFFLYGAVYLRINPLQQRYNTHLFPVWVLTSSYALDQLVGFNFRNKIIKQAVVFLLLIVAAAQIYTTYQGLRPWHNGVWYRPSYEETAAGQVQQLLSGEERLIVSFPEPYYYFSGHPTNGVSPQPPFILTENFTDEEELVIVNDMGMRFLYPELSDFLNERLADYRVNEFFIDVPFRYTYEEYEEDEPIQIYKIQNSQLHGILSK